MLKRFTVSNFKNFGEKLTLELGDPANYAFNRQAVSDGVKAKAIVYGANGSGKSNLALALFDVVSHATDKECIPQKYVPYLNLEVGGEMAEFEYVFDFGGSEVAYRYGKADSTALVYESLSICGEEVLAYDFAKRSGFVSIDGAETLQLTSDMPSETDRISRVKYVRKNAILRNSERSRLFLAFTSFLDRMLMFYSLDEKGYQGLSIGPDSFTSGIIREGRLDDFQSFLTERGLSYDLVAVDVNGLEEIYCRYGDRTVPFMSVASTGTRSLALFYYWYIKMGGASLVLVDEFDAFYHFELSKDIVRLLRDLDGVQVILTTHNTDLLSNDLLRPDSYFILRDGSVRSLDHLTHKELRSAHNIQKMFKAGSFDE